MKGFPNNSHFPLNNRISTWWATVLGHLRVNVTTLWHFCYMVIHLTCGDSRCNSSQDSCASIWGTEENLASSLIKAPGKEKQETCTALCNYGENLLHPLLNLAALWKWSCSLSLWQQHRLNPMMGVQTAIHGGWERNQFFVDWHIWEKPLQFLFFLNLLCKIGE